MSLIDINILIIISLSLTFKYIIKFYDTIQEEEEEAKQLKM